jgi:hypothetical protein
MYIDEQVYCSITNELIPAKLIFQLQAQVFNCCGKKKTPHGVSLAGLFSSDGLTGCLH